MEDRDRDRNIDIYFINPARGHCFATAAFIDTSKVILNMNNGQYNKNNLII